MTIICYTVMVYENVSLEILFSFLQTHLLYCGAAVLRQERETNWSEMPHKLKANVYGKTSVAYGRI
jgi:hypothetical protein